MVSYKINGFQISESRQKLHLAERMKSLDDGRSERPFMKLEDIRTEESRDFGNGR
jgi:hypothetical protein